MNYQQKKTRVKKSSVSLYKNVRIVDEIKKEKKQEL